MNNKDLNLKKIRVAIYHDKGVSELSYQSLFFNFAKKIEHFSKKIKITLHSINSNDILNNKLIKDKFDCLIIPGGADLPYCEKLNNKGNENIKEFIKLGKLYIGICAGSYYASKYIDFIGLNPIDNKIYKIKGKRELCFFYGSAIGSIKQLTNGKYYNDMFDSKAMINLSKSNKRYYYHGGPYFIADKNTKYEELLNYTFNNKELPAVILGEFGYGKYLLSGVHFELSHQIYKNLILQKLNTESYEYKIEKEIYNHLKEDGYGSELYISIASILESLPCPM